MSQSGRVLLVQMDVLLDDLGYPQIAERPGAGLAAFSGGLLGLYARTPGMRKQNSPFPTQQGIPLAKDAWMMGIGLGLVIDDLTDRPSPKD
jgi:hypothetical protein